MILLARARSTRIWNTRFDEPKRDITRHIPGHQTIYFIFRRDEEGISNDIPGVGVKTKGNCCRCCAGWRYTLCKQTRDFLSISTRGYPPTNNSFVWILVPAEQNLFTTIFFVIGLPHEILHSIHLSILTRVLCKFTSSGWCVINSFKKGEKIGRRYVVTLRIFAVAKTTFHAIGKGGWKSGANQPAGILADKTFGRLGRVKLAITRERTCDRPYRSLCNRRNRGTSS